MKVYALAAAVLCTSIFPVMGQSPEQEELKRINNLLEDLQTAVTSLQRRVGEVERENNSLREQVARLKSSNPTAALSEEIKYLREKLAEVAKKQEDDKELILKSFRDLGKTIASTPAPPPPRPRTDPVPNLDPNQKFIEYPIQAGDTYDSIRVSYNKKLKAEGKKTQLTTKQIMDLNPHAEAEKLIPGRTVIYLPIPPE